MFDKDITVINKYFDRQTKTNKYKISYVRGFWNYSQGISINGTQLTKQDGLTAIILIKDSRNETYQEPKEFEKEQKTWTLKPDDYLVKGKVKDFTTITQLSEEYQEVMKITNIAINDNGSENMWNFEVTGA